MDSAERLAAGLIPTKLAGDLALDEQELLTDLVEQLRARGDKLTRQTLAMECLRLSPDFSIDLMKLSSSVKQIPPVVKRYKDVETIPLPPPTSSTRPIGELITNRRSRRDFSGERISLREVSSLIYHAWGIRGYTSAYGVNRFPLRTVPSSGGLQSAEAYLVVNATEDLPQGLFHYAPEGHSLELLIRGNLRRKLVHVCAFDEFVGEASVIVILTSVLDRLTWKYGYAAMRYALVDIGFIGQNLYLIGEALGLGVCAIAGFIEDMLNPLLEIDGSSEFACLLLAVGRPPIGLALA